MIRRPFGALEFYRSAFPWGSRPRLHAWAPSEPKCKEPRCGDEGLAPQATCLGSFGARFLAAPLYPQILGPRMAAVAPSGLMDVVGPAYLGLAPQATCRGSFGAQMQRAPGAGTRGSRPRLHAWALSGAQILGPLAYPSRYLSSYSIPCFSSRAISSSLKETWAWWLSWFRMYCQTFLTWDSLTVKAP
jgi:hypothetical protein